MTQDVLNEQELENLKNISKSVRANIVKMIHNASSGHPGGALSCTDILVNLYFKCMNHYPDWNKNPEWANRDRFVLSKGPASAAYYAVLAECGYFPKDELLTFRKLGTRLQGHPSYGHLPGVEVSTGSLGQGLSIACGMALGLKLDKKPSKVFAIMGDGEIQEGSIWEAAMNASHNKLENLIAFVDRNVLQIDGNTENIKSLNPLPDKWEAFGWNVFEIDGHCHKQIFETVQSAISKNKETQKPSVIIANTLKGKGISFMEDNAGWHGKAPSDEDLASAMKELEG